MSRENVEIVRGIYADPRGLTAGASGKVAPDAEFDLTIRDDLVVRFKVYGSREQALEAVGLAE